MKAKTIKLILANRVKGLVKSIDDEKVKKAVEQNTIITGGCITSMLLNEDVNDFDIYFRDKETTLLVTNYYVNKFNAKNNTKIQVREEGYRIKIYIKSAGAASEHSEETKEETRYQYFEQVDPSSGVTAEYIENLMYVLSQSENKTKEKRFRPVFLSTNAITLSDKIQIITRFYGEPDKIHESFDFVHCTNWWCSWDNRLELRKDALECILTKELKYRNSEYPLCALIRTRKFVKKGWTINAGQILKMVLQLGDMDLKDESVLEEQLTGVDIAYFHELLLKLKDKKDITTTYIIELIDKIF